MLAEVITRTLADDAIYERCRAEASGVRQHFTWARAADDVVRVVSGSLA